MEQRIRISSAKSVYISIEDFCPNCNKPTNPHVINTENFSEEDGSIKIAITLRCLGCRHFWVEEFVVESFENFHNVKQVKVKPALPSDIQISDNLEAVSPLGKEIYLQALKAEQERLDFIAGIGYRKALEFLIKDFVLITEKVDVDTIVKMPLKQVIEKYVTDPDLKTFSLASTYIGNDEGHYYRRNPDKDLSDLKKYLHGTIYYLETKLTFLDAQELLNRSKKS